MTYLKVLVVLFSVIASAPALAEFNCKRANTPEKFQSALGAELDRLNGEYQVRVSAYKAKLDASSRALLDQGVWTEESKAAFFTRLAEAPEFTEQEKQVRYYSGFYQTELRMAFTVGAINPAGACGHAGNVISFFSSLVAASEKQWIFMESQVQSVPSTRASGGG